MTASKRVMRMDQMSMMRDDAVVQIIAPDVMTAEELDDVREMFALKLRQWERLAKDAAAITDASEASPAK
jgi:uncharacterized radical SAM superfamily Fe-S cluster-containing enzyme